MHREYWSYDLQNAIVYVHFIIIIIIAKTSKAPERVGVVGRGTQLRSSCSTITTASMLTELSHQLL